MATVLIATTLLGSSILFTHASSFARRFPVFRDRRTRGYTADSEITLHYITLKLFRVA